MHACLSKDPKARPESAGELRRLLEACEVEPWDSALAQGWWREHQLRVEDDGVTPDETARTIAIDGARRESPVTPGAITAKA